MSRRDLERLDGLAWVYRGFSALFAFFGLWVWLPSIGRSLSGGSWQLAGCSLLYGLLALSWAAALFVAARWLMVRQRHAACLAVGVTLLVFFPFGTAAGVWAISLLRRPPVRGLFRS